MREHRTGWKGVHTPGYVDPLFLPTPTHRESHGDILNFYSHPTNGMKISPTEVLWRKLGGEKKKKKKERKRDVEHKCVSRAGRRESLLEWDGTGMLLRRRTSDTKLLFKYSVYSNSEIQYKNRDIY